MGKFVIIRKTAGKYQVQLKSRAGTLLLNSREYTTKISCKKTIECLRSYAGQANKFQKKTSTEWELYFYLKSNNGKTIATSVLFPSTLSREQAIKRVQKLAPIAAVEDES
ncbi:YegP family protein [Flavobacterium sp. AC]|uniref:YegP family protein n=1 Tax=Flavobacterium azizsancarii TaxID=2961580 RepID=A0ABT4WBK8_9FLAO|nr:YegP family protein [Flavobacterium azizsancarii]MDA6069963.1 YegP family protein [Flavobacterium azizsancarii]